MVVVTQSHIILLPPYHLAFGLVKFHQPCIWPMLSLYKSLYLLSPFWILPISLIMLALPLSVNIFSMIWVPLAGHLHRSGITTSPRLSPVKHWILLPSVERGPWHLSFIPFCLGSVFIHRKSPSSLLWRSVNYPLAVQKQSPPIHLFYIVHCSLDHRSP